MKSFLTHVLFFFGLALAFPSGRKALKFSKEEKRGFISPPLEFLLAVDPACCCVPFQQGDQYEANCSREEFFRLIHCSFGYSNYAGRLNLNPQVEVEFLALRTRLEPLKGTPFVKSICAQVKNVSCDHCQQIINKWHTEFRNLIVLRFDFRLRNPEDIGMWQGLRLKNDTSQFLIKCDEIDTAKLFEWKLPLESVLNVDVLYSIDLYGPLFLIGPVDSAFDNCNTFKLGKNLENLSEILQALIFAWKVSKKEAITPRREIPIEHFLFIREERLKLGLPLLIQAGFPFEGPIEAFIQICRLIPDLSTFEQEIDTIRRHTLELPADFVVNLRSFPNEVSRLENLRGTFHFDELAARIFLFEIEKLEERNCAPKKLFLKRYFEEIN